MIFLVSAAVVVAAAIGLSVKKLSEFRSHRNWPLDEKIGTINILSDEELQQAYQGKRVLVVGGTRGVGFGLAQAVARGGAHVTVVGRSAAAGTIALETLGRNASFVQGDIGTVANSKALVTKLEQLKDPFDYFAVTAAVFPDWSGRPHQQDDGIDVPFAIAVVGRYVLYKNMFRFLKPQARVLNVLASGEALPKHAIDHDLSSGKRNPTNLFDSISNFSCGNEVMQHLLDEDPKVQSFTRVSTHPGMLKTELHQGQGVLFDVLEHVLVTVAGISVEDCGRNQASILASPLLRERSLSYVSSDRKGHTKSPAVVELIEAEQPWLKEFLEKVTGQ